MVSGRPDPRFVSTSYVECRNVTIGMAIRRFTRLTSAPSKKPQNLKAALSLPFAWYNFRRIHGSLRVTPATAAGATDRLWTVDDLAFGN